MTIGIKFKIHRPDGTIISVRSTDTDMPFSDVIDLFKEFAIAAGYSQTTIGKFLSPSDNPSRDTGDAE